MAYCKNRQTSNKVAQLFQDKGRDSQNEQRSKNFAKIKIAQEARCYSVHKGKSEKSHKG